MKARFLSLALALAWGFAASATAAAPYAGGVLMENFDTLPLTGSTTLAGTNQLGFQVPVPGLPGWQVARVGGNSITDAAIHTQQLTGGRAYSYGSSGDSDRALGCLGSGTAFMAFGVALLNEGTETITELPVEYLREIWMLQSTTTANYYENRLVFSYGVEDGNLAEDNFLTNPAMIPHAPLDAVSPASLTLISAVDGTSPGRARNGNDPEFREKLFSVLTGLNWGPGQLLFLRWTDADDAGFDAGIAVDDLVIGGSSTPPETALAIQPLLPDRVRLTWPSIPGVDYDLSVTEDLQTWQTGSARLFEAAGNRLSYIDAAAGRRFYRISERTGPPPAPVEGTASVFFNRPGPAGTDPDLALEAKLTELLRQAQPGSTIRAAVYTWDRQVMTDEFVAAHERGVDVRVIIGGDFPAVESLAARLPAGHVIACRNQAGEVIGAMGGRINHNKFFLFSDLGGGGTEVVAQSSANLTEFQLTRNNNMVVLRGYSDLYQAFLRYWNDLSACIPDLNYYRLTGRNAGTAAYFFPRASGNGVTGQGDTVAELLDDISEPAGTVIRVAMATWSNPRRGLATKLVSLFQNGADVAVVINPDEAGNEVLQILESAGLPVYRYPQVHSKYLLIDGVWRGTARKVILTGSHNFTGPALTGNDEVLLRLQNDALHTAFLADWEEMRVHPLTH